MLSEDLDPHEFYQLIEIRIFPANSEGGYPVELNVQGGRNFAQATLRLDLERLKGLDADPKAYGRLLGEALFADDVLGNAYRETRAVAQGRDKGLRVCLRLDVSELQAIHWERIYHPFDRDWYPLGNTADTPFSRYIPAPSWKSQRLITERPLKVLAVIASPTNLDRYALDPLAQSERAALHTSLDGLSDVTVTYLETGTSNPPTLNQLRKVLADGYHLVHFLCHGAVTGGGTILYLEDEHGNVGHVTTDELVGLFNDLRDPPVFCFLAACESATRAANDAFAPLGPTLVQHGNIQAVVAMTDRVGVVTAQRFADQFYKRLLHHGIVDLAVNEARALIQDEWDWGAPAYFTHLKHGQLLSRVKDDIPDVYVAHPYALLDTKDLVGRKSELQLLTDWVTKSDKDIYKVRIVSIVAIGGMGKSALAWKWFNDIVPQTMKPLAGRMWWSFYEVDSSFEDFVTHALAFVSGQPNEKLQEIPLPEREARLLAILDKKPFLLVLDGLERIMLAYNRGDAAHMLDDNLDDQAATSIISMEGLSESISPSFTNKRDLRETSDPRAGMFLRKLASIHASRVLITTRLNPTKLQTITFEDLPGTKAIPLRGLDNDSAMELWQSLHLTGSRENMLPLFNSFENYPLLIRILAGTVAKYRNAPGNFDKWRADKPDFDPFKQPLVNVKSHVLFFALQGLDKPARDVLYTIAAFRGPVAHDVISKLLIGGNKPCKDEDALDTILTELEDRSLLGWERKKNSNRYDMHPTIRGVIWSGLDSKIQQKVYTELNAYYESAFGKPQTWLKSFDDFAESDWMEVNDLEELSLGIDIYHTLIGLQRYDDAYYHFEHHLDDALQWRFAANYRIIALLEMLFPVGVEQKRLGDETRRAAIVNLAVAYQKSGQPGKAHMLFNQDKDLRVDIHGLYSQANTLLVIGKLYQGEVVAQQAIELSRKVGAISLVKDYSSFQLMSDKSLLDLAEGIYPEALSLHALALNLAARGMADDSRRVMNHCLSLIKDLHQPSMEGLTNAVYAQCEIWCRDDKAAQPMAEKAWSLAHHQLVEPHLIRAARLQGEAALGMKELPKAEERLYHALDRARKASYVEEELSALVGLAKLQLLKGDHTSSRERLNDIWEFAEHGPFPLIHADALNVLAQLERDANNRERAIEAAARAMRLAWCDGPPFIYHRGLLEAQEFLSELGASIPSDLPPFDFSQAEEISHEQDRLREETMISSANQMMQQARNQEELLITCKKLVNENPKDALAHYCLGRVYYESERYQEAIEAFQRLSQLEPAFGLPYFTLSLIFEKIDLINDALSTSEKAVKLNSMNLNYLYQLFRMYYITESKDVAVQTLERMIMLSPGTISYYQLLADICYEMERPEEALDMFSFAIGNEVNIVEACIGRADLLRKLGRLKEALKDLEYAMAMNREVNPFQRKFECWIDFLQALVLMALKRKSEAKSQLIKAAKSVDDLLNSKDQLTENGRCYLSYQKAIYMLVGKQPKEALDLFSSTVEKYGNINVRDALDDLERYLQVFPNDKTAHDAHRLLTAYQERN